MHAHAVSTGPSFPLTLRRSGDKANYQSIYRGSNYYAGGAGGRGGGGRNEYISRYSQVPSLCSRDDLRRI